MELADIVECDFPGYQAITLDDFGETDRADDDIGEALTDVHSFTASEDIVTPQNIYFFYITRHPAGLPVQLFQVVNLPEPIQFAVPGQTFELQVRAMSEGLE